MQSLSEKEIVKKIEAGEIFECESNDGSLTLKIETYTPSICTAIHAGHNFRESLHSYCALSEDQRLFEEDPHTDQFIQAMPITLIAKDSRYEYDLNRPLAACIYNTAWGKKVWKKSLPKKERNISIRKHQTFYNILNTLIWKIEKLFGASIVFDIHAYNYERFEGSTPTFNLGTEQIDNDRWEKVLSNFTKGLRKIELPNIPVSVARDKVFYGKGYMITHVISRFDNTLVLPLEIKKIYMDESTGESYPLVINALTLQFKDCMVDISAYFARRFSNKKRLKRADMLTEKLDPQVLKVDQKLFKLARGLETLYYINPTNIQVEKRKFLKSFGKYIPNFRYRQLNIDPYLFREKLYRLPVDSIRDPAIQSLYRDVINSLSEKIDMLVKAGQPEFVYESLKYYGEPTQTDEQNAAFLLHATQFKSEDDEHIGTSDISDLFKTKAKEWNMRCRVEVTNRLVALAMVSSRRKAVLLSKGLALPMKDAKALLHHELGVHMLTTLNANIQRLKVFSLGLPGNTVTQEGLAILNEYQSGNLTLNRLKTLAYRVIAVKEMLKHGSFRHTYTYLHEEQKLDSDDAFRLALRVHRGGGLTKDYLYLQGISEALNMYNNQSIDNLYVGKTGFDYLPIINEMVERQLVKQPKYLPEFIKKPAEESPVLKYLISCISNNK